MKPPPSTPTPRRFLTKRPAPSQLPHSTPTPMRFQSTPRFGSTQSATRQMEDVEESDVGTSQSQSQSQNSMAEQPRFAGRDIVSDSIEVDSYADSLASQGVPQSSGSSEHDMEDDAVARPQTDYTSDKNEDENDATIIDAPSQYVDEDAGTPPVKRRRLSPSASPTRQHGLTYDSDTAGYEEQPESERNDEEENDVQDQTRTRAPVQQPTFRPAPRFKPAPEDEFLAHDQGGSTDALLAAPFSPQRRGAKYVAGGLASQLQGLLSQVKGSESLGGGGGGDGMGDGAIVRLVVQEVKLGTRMHLIRGKILSRGSVAESEEKVQNYILAGGGARLVKEGSVLRIMAAPAWDVQLGEEWTVACEWSIESLES